MKKIISKVAFELIVITLGVLIALGINAWYNNFQQRQTAEQLLTKIAYELQQNIIRLETAASSYQQSIEQSNQYEHVLEETGETEQYAFVFKMLTVKQGAWQFSQNRDELNTLPVELLISLDAANRSTSEAKTMVNQFIFESHDELDELLENDLYVRYLDGMKRELTQVKFYLDYALLSSKSALTDLESYRETGKIAAKNESVELSTTL
ncbi:hypothetical protein [Pseudoalteromonas piratica]|uniref:Uncharacterized protein n=1 Tax=Pseudoalteromonas piratica TaxID=1348114 RepID=A0A0A7ELD5_9GAMM|nr:hypothetical protein [Pseudoalteromonas piratica]AIY67353.1 hypothetical protein OM33_20165 [Pseudoalteromonas piratica]